jgi:Cu+-exporting ATPase
MKEIQLSIGGMTCASCANVLTKTLKKVEGTKDANVNFATEQATVEFDPSVSKIEDYVNAVKKKGYEATALGEEEEDVEQKQAKSCVSEAPVKTITTQTQKKKKLDHFLSALRCRWEWCSYLF